MRRLVLALSLCAGFVTWTIPAAAQAAAEAGLGAGASSIGTAGAGGVGKAVGGILRGLDKTIKPADAAPSQFTVKLRRSAPQPQTPTPNYEDAARIEKGMPVEDVLRRFGPPAMQIASGSDTQTMTYLGKSGMVQVELEAGRVVSVAGPKSGA